MYLVFTRMPGESYRRRPFLYLCYAFRALINSFVWCSEKARIFEESRVKRWREGVGVGRRASTS